MHFPTIVRTRLEHVRNARRTREGMRAYQLARFRKFVANTVAKAPYYRDLVADLGIDVATCRPEDFPEMGKATLIEHFDRIVTDPSITKAAIVAFLERSKDSYELFNDRYYIVSTSGTSGTKGYIAYSREDWSRGITHALRVNPPQLGVRRLAYFARTRGHHVGVSFASSTKRWPVSMIYQTATFDLDEPMDTVIERLNAFRPTIIMGYPSALALLARQQLKGTLNIHPKWAQCSGEPVTKGDRHAVQIAFGIPLANVYSSTEHMMMGIGRSDYDGMYLLEDDLIFELKDNRTLVTNMFNTTTPLIRYTMNDMLVPKADVTRQYPFTKVEEIVERGETTAVFVNRHGVEDTVQIASVMADNVRGFQIRIVGKSACAVSVCLEAGLESDLRAAALRAIEQEFVKLLATKDMENVRVSAEEVPDLERDPRSGKVSLVVKA